jgi:hypothetical protein
MLFTTSFTTVSHRAGLQMPSNRLFIFGCTFQARIQALAASSQRIDTVSLECRISEAQSFLLQIKATRVIVVSRKLLAARSTTPDADDLCGLIKAPVD